MDEPENESAATGGESTGASQPGVMIRGADGALYIVTEKDLAPFRVPNDKAKELTRILGGAPTNMVSYDLPADLMRTVHELAKCVGANAEIKIPKQ